MAYSNAEVPPLNRANRSGLAPAAGSDAPLGDLNDSDVRSIAERLSGHIDRLIPFPALLGLTAIEINSLVERAIKKAVEDFCAYLQSDPACAGDPKRVRSITGVLAVADYRLAHELYATDRAPLRQIAVEIWQRSKRDTHIDIHPEARIGPRFVIDHGANTVIGQTVFAGSDFTVYQAVTVGVARATTDEGQRHATIGDDVKIAGGARILGPVFIGNGVRIGPDVTVRESIPDNCSVYAANEMLAIVGRETALPPVERADYHALTICPDLPNHILIWGENLVGAEVEFICLESGEPHAALGAAVVSASAHAITVLIERTTSKAPLKAYGLELRTLRGLRVLISGARALKRVVEGARPC
jgi:serine O-acetyltransferase